MKHMWLKAAPRFWWSFKVCRLPLLQHCNHLTHNLPGPQISIYGAFYDGKVFVIEPLGQPVPMLRGWSRTREHLLTRYLTALKMGHSSILKLVRCANYSSPLIQKYVNILLQQPKTSTAQISPAYPPALSNMHSLRLSNKLCS